MIQPTDIRYPVLSLMIIFGARARLNVLSIVSSWSFDALCVEIICNLPVSHTTIMQWFYEIVIALLLFSVLLFCTAIISTDYDIETEILEESSVRKTLPWATALKRSMIGRSFNATHPTLTLLTDLFNSHINSSEHFTDLMKGEGSQGIYSSDHKRSVSINSTPMVKSFHRHKLYPTKGIIYVLMLRWFPINFGTNIILPFGHLSLTR